MTVDSKLVDEIVRIFSQRQPDDPTRQRLAVSFDASSDTHLLPEFLANKRVSKVVVYNPNDKQLPAGVEVFVPKNETPTLSGLRMSIPTILFYSGEHTQDGQRKLIASVNKANTNRYFVFKASNRVAAFGNYFAEKIPGGPYIMWGCLQSKPEAAAKSEPLPKSAEKREGKRPLSPRPLSPRPLSPSNKKQKTDEELRNLAEIGSGWVHAISSKSEWLLNHDAHVKPQNANAIESDEAWLTKLKESLFHFLAPIVPQPATREKYVSEKAMGYWVRVFTHKSYNYMVNYEELETLGDQLLGTAFLDYILRRKPTWDAQDLTNLKKAYMSKTFQAKVGSLCGFASMLRINSAVVTDSVLEDTMEAFTGGLFRVGNMVNEGFGYIDAYNYVYLIFNQMDIQQLSASMDYKTYVEQTFEMLGWKSQQQQKDNLTIEQKDGTFVTTIWFTEKAKDFLRQNGMRMPFRDSVLAIGKHATQKGSLGDAYKRAKNQLIEMGITETFREKHRGNISRYVSAKLRDAVDSAAKELGFENVVVVEEEDPGTKTQLKTLIGVHIREETRTVAAKQSNRLHSVKVDTDKYNMYTSLYQGFLDKLQGE